MILDVDKRSEDADEHTGRSQHDDDPNVDGSIRPDISVDRSAIGDCGRCASHSGKAVWRVRAKLELGEGMLSALSDVRRMDRSSKTAFRRADCHRTTTGSALERCRVRLRLFAEEVERSA